MAWTFFTLTVNWSHKLEVFVCRKTHPLVWGCCLSVRSSWIFFYSVHVPSLTRQAGIEPERAKRFLKLGTTSANIRAQCLILFEVYCANFTGPFLRYRCSCHMRLKCVFTCNVYMHALLHYDSLVALLAVPNRKEENVQHSSKGCWRLDR